MSRILIVDDTPEVRELLHDFIESRGHQPTTASDGAEALESVRKSRPDLILLDLMMPGMSGLSVLRQLRTTAAAVPVIVVTAIHQEEIGRAALDDGATDYVTKPVDLAYLERAVNAALLARGG